jgi:hypothetical protein
LYTCIPNFRHARLHRAVPFFEYSNQLVFADKENVDPEYLASWYGNVKSIQLRKTMVETLKVEGRFCIKTSQSWYNHKGDEQKAYVELIKSSKFSLCPVGFAPPVQEYTKVWL